MNRSWRYARGRRAAATAVASALLLVWAAAGCEPPEETGEVGSEEAADAEPEYRVWAMDQNLDELFVLDPDGGVLDVVGSEALGGAARPHMLWGVPGDGYVYSANTVSESVTILDRDSGETLHVIEDVGKAPHAAQPNPVRPDHVYIFNIGPQEVGEDGEPDRGETLAEVIREGSGSDVTWELTRYLDLAASPALADDDLFPSRRPVCGGFSQDGRHMLVTLFDGGLAVVDLEEWEVTRAWGNDEVAQHGCGFAPSLDGSELYVTAGGMESSFLYVFDVAGEEPDLVASHDLSEVGQDAHGVYVDPVREELWVLHRVSDNATIHPLNVIHEAGHDFEEVEFVGSAPDLIAFSPDGDRAYVSLRGPDPAPTIPHATVGETPGVAILDVETRELLDVVTLGDLEDSDFHALFIPESHHGLASQPQ